MPDNGVIQRGVLTKRLFMSCDAGVFLSSNCTDGTGCPIIAETITFKGPGREEQWRKIAAARASHRICTVFKDKACFVRWEDSVKNLPWLQ